MGRVLLITDEAEQDIFEIMKSRASFDKSSALHFASLVLEKGRLLLDSVVSYEVVHRAKGREYRRFLVKSVSVIYHENESFVEIARVFGPGRDWQSEL